MLIVNVVEVPEGVVHADPPVQQHTPTTPPTQKSARKFEEDEILTSHHRHIVDAVSRSSVNEDTRLAALYQYTDVGMDNRLLQQLTQTAGPAARCRLVVLDGAFPPASAPATLGYDLYITFEKLLLAPAVHLDCVLDLADGTSATLTFQFHFNRCGNVKSLKNFRWVTSRTDLVEEETHSISFTSRGATKTGCVRTGNAVLSKHQCVLLDALRNVTAAGANVSLRLDLLDVSNVLARLRCRLPGGEGPLLPSLKKPEYAAFGTSHDRVNVNLDGMLTPDQLMQADPPFPMLSLECSETFTSIKEAAIQLSYSARIADLEARESLNLWAKARHPARLMQFGNEFAVVAVNFAPFTKLGSQKDSTKYRLPSQLHVEMRFDASGHKSTRYHGLLVDDIPGVPVHDAFFVITSYGPEHFGADLCRLPHEEPVPRFLVKFLPSMPTFGIESQLLTVQGLIIRDRWHPLVLNQGDEVATVDLTNFDGLTQAEVSSKQSELLHFVPKWNPEQLQAIDGIRHTKGGFHIVMGPAGTGKTLLQQALAVYFWKLGYHILALTPANSNADHLTRIMARLDDGDIRFHRLYPSSRDLGADNIVGSTHNLLTDGGFTELQFGLNKLKSRKHEKADARDYGVEQAVVDEADKGDLHLYKRTPPGLRHLGEEVDIWSEFKASLSRARAGDASYKRAEHLLKYTWAFEECKAHIIRLSRFIITTTGNARATDLMQNFGRDEMGRVNMKHMVVFVDEACKDTELNIWSPIVCSEWADKVRGCVLFGDDRQLKPTNTSSKGDLDFNPWNKRLDIPLPVRLANQGFPVVRLKEQMRMHRSIADFPNRMFYDGLLRDGPGTNQLLSAVRPGLTETLQSIIAPKIRDMTEKFDLTQRFSDIQCRLHYIEVDGDVERHPRTHSVKVASHPEIFFRDIFPKLHEYFGDTMEENVMVICAYSYALHHWTALASQKAKAHRLSTKHLPRMVMLDSSQGQESFMVIFDGSLQYRDRLGFLTDPGRCNVAMTRAQGVFWMIGGKLAKQRKHPSKDELSFVPLYRAELEAKKVLHRF